MWRPIYKGGWLFNMTVQVFDRVGCEDYTSIN